MHLLLTLVVTIVAFTGIWLINVRIRDAGIVDYYWGPGFAVIGWIHLYFIATPTPAQWIFATAVTIWAVRLALHLIARHRRSSAEDARYRAMRETGGPHWWWYSLFTIFWLQALLLWAIAAPVHLALQESTAQITSLFIFGLIVFAAGFATEWVADSQLARAKEGARQSSAALVNTGLWAISRHPNYLGEIALWWGLAVCAYAISGAFLAFAGPALLTAVIFFVSAPLTENHLRSSRPGYDAYAQSVPMIIPAYLRSRTSSGQAAE